MVRARPLASLTQRAPTFPSQSSSAPRRRRLRLDFDGGPWLGAYPVAHLSPWVEILVGATAGVAFGLHRASGPMSTVGWLIGSALAADALQALLPTTFRRRVVASGLGAVPVTWLCVRMVVSVWGWIT